MLTTPRRPSRFPFAKLEGKGTDSRAPPPQVGGAQAMDPFVKLSSAQRALLHRIKEAREWYQGSDPDTRFRIADPVPPACVREGTGGQPSTVEQLVHGCAALYIDLLKVSTAACRLTHTRERR